MAHLIPFLDLRREDGGLAAETARAALRVIQSGRYILGPEVEDFEDAWSAYCGTRFCIGTGNGLDALRLILLAHGIGAGHEVIVPANTYIATWLAVSQTGATPVPVDAKLDTQNIDPARVEDAITERTKAIIAVHMYGLPAEMDALAAIADRFELKLFEDAAHAHGAVYKGARAGNLGNAAMFSFYPTKNLGAIGDAGCVTTNDEEIAQAVRRLRNYGGGGQVGKYDHQVQGYNSRLDELQAAVLSARLLLLDKSNARRWARAEDYLMSLAGFPVKFQESGGGRVWHQFVIRVDAQDRDALRDWLASQEIGTEIHYPVPPHLTEAYAGLGLGSGSFPVAERLANENISLPIGYDVEVEAVARKVVAGLSVMESRR